MLPFTLASAVPGSCPGFGWVSCTTCYWSYSCDMYRIGASTATESGSVATWGWEAFLSFKARSFFPLPFISARPSPASSHPPGTHGFLSLSTGLPLPETLWSVCLRLTLLFILQDPASTPPPPESCAVNLGSLCSARTSCLHSTASPHSPGN